LGSEHSEMWRMIDGQVMGYAATLGFGFLIHLLAGG
jgi:hypothetical protein